VGLIVGVLLAIAVGAFATGVGLDRDRAFYPVVTIIVASYYALFAVMGGSSHALLVELLVAALFLLAAVLGFKSSLWLVAAALAAHGIFDFARGTLINNPGVPGWWPPFCAAYDLTAAVYLAWLLRSQRVRAEA
jgi:hypothetical protein